MPSPSTSLTPAPKRRWLTFSLRTFLVVTLGLSLVLGYFGRAWWKAYRDSQPPTLYELAQIAKRHGIPMPPQRAKLVLATPGYFQLSFDGRPQYSPAFLIAEGQDGAAVVLRGFAQAELPAVEASDPQWREFSIDRSRADSAGYRLAPPSAAVLLCAIQLAERGDTDQADAIMQHIRQEDQPLENCPLPVTDGILPDLREFVRYYAFLHLEHRLQNEPDAWPEIRQRMTVLLNESALVRRDKTDLLQDLAAAVDAATPRPRSVEALLCDWSRHSKASMEMHPGAQEILRRGFDAVPDLIALRDDQRLTAQAIFYDTVDGNNGYLRLGDLAHRALTEISGARRGEALSVAMDDELDNMDAAAWQRWWDQAQAQGERGYCIRNLLGADGRVRAGPMRILTHKHADTLATLGREYQRLSPRPVSPSRVANALSWSELPRLAKVEALADLAQVSTPDDKRDVLKLLMAFDRERTIDLFIRLLEEVTADDRDFDFPSPNETFPYLVAALNDERLTKAYLNAARRNTPLRMELLSRLVHSHAVYERSTLRLALLAAFLDDKSMRERLPEYERFIPDDFTEISVGDFAAAQLARVFQLGMRPRLDWTPEQWSALRAEVRERLKQEKLPALE